ncbi:MAG: hypothetical protein E7435_04575 [Ruminococcaceae bacterium]|nr:hypothetical protein [Oscillospiraceae bacterium]
METTADVMATLQIGNEVILSATRGLNTGSGKTVGQTCLKSATVAVNNYGSHNYPTAAFKGEISVAEFTKLDVATDYTTNVYTMKATIKVEVTNNSTNVYLSDGTNEAIVYAGNGKTQLAWLIAMKDQQVTVEVAPCNWNSKGYKAAVLAVINSDGTKTLSTLNFAN